MIVLDTHVLVWHRSAPERLSPDASRAIDAADGIAVSAISCWEVAMLVERGRIGLDRSPAAWLRQATADLDVVAPTCPIALAAAGLDARRFVGDPADRLIWATTRHLGATLVTADRALREYAPNDTVW